MSKRSTLALRVDRQGRIRLPKHLIERYGLAAGDRVRLEESPTGLTISRPANNLAKIYIEPTNQCNLDCRTCVRHVWQEQAGWMSAETFERILASLAALAPMPSVFFGGFGEPLAHPRILDMVAQVKAAGAAVELITNGILLNESTTQRLVELGLDRLWVSLDGATPESYADVRLGAELPRILDHLRNLARLRALAYADKPRLGIAFVAMRRNIHDLPEVVRLGRLLGADQFSITNVIPHTPELGEEILFRQSMYQSLPPAPDWTPTLALPRMDVNDLTREPLAAVLQARNTLSLARQELHQGANTCPFVERGSVAIRWDGAVSPCLPLLHTHVNYLDDRLRRTEAYAAGDINERSLLEIWNDPAYASLRQRLLEFDFSPCVYCNSCDMPEGNREDCYGNVQPACGGCLWAQGFIQCP